MKVSTRSSTTSDRNDKASESKSPSSGQRSGTESAASSSTSSAHFTFEMSPQHIDKGRKKSFKCDVCCAMYKHSFSLKRHFIRAHVNYTYLCETDIVNCGINLQASPSVAVWKETGKADVDCNVDTSTASNINSPGCNYKMVGLYACHTCILFFTHLPHLRDHVSKVHADEAAVVSNKRSSTKSPVPSVVLRSKRSKGSSCDSDSSSTKQTSKKGVFYDCSECDETFYSNANLLRHVQNVHKQSSAKSSNKIRSLASSSSGDRKWQHFSHTNPDDVGYFSSVSKQIADNLLNHVDGKLSTCSQQQSQPNEVVSTCVSSSVTSSSSTLSNSSLRRSSRIHNPISSASTLTSSVSSSTGLSGTSGQEISSSSSSSSSLPVPKIDLTHFNFAPPPPVDTNLQSTVDDEEQAKLDYLHANDLQSKRNAPVVTIFNDYKSFVQSNSTDNYFKEVASSPVSKDPYNYICTVCSCRCLNRVNFWRHWKNNHPDVNCSYVRIDPNNDVPSKLLLWRYNSPNGLLKSCSTANYPGTSKADTDVHCTKCRSKFQSIDLLHSHILECARMPASTKPLVAPASSAPSPLIVPSEVPIEEENTTTDAPCSKPDPWKVIQDNPLYVFKGSPSQFHSCPYCQRGFTYLANYRKHMKGICPVRMQMEDPNKFDSREKESESAEEDDPRSDTTDDLNSSTSQAVTDEKASHECYKCMKVFKSYFDLLKHRLSHKLMNDQAAVNSDETHENGL